MNYGAFKLNKGTWKVKYIKIIYNNPCTNHNPQEKIILDTENSFMTTIRNLKDLDKRSLWIKHFFAWCTVINKKKLKLFVMDILFAALVNCFGNSDMTCSYTELRPICTTIVMINQQNNNRLDVIKTTSLIFYNYL